MGSTRYAGNPRYVLQAGRGGKNRWMKRSTPPKTVNVPEKPVTLKRRDDAPKTVNLPANIDWMIRSIADSVTAGVFADTDTGRNCDIHTFMVSPDGKYASVRTVRETRHHGVTYKKGQTLVVENRTWRIAPADVIHQSWGGWDAMWEERSRREKTFVATLKSTEFGEHFADYGEMNPEGTEILVEVKEDFGYMVKSAGTFPVTAGDKMQFDMETGLPCGIHVERSGKRKYYTFDR